MTEAQKAELTEFFRQFHNRTLTTINYIEKKVTELSFNASLIQTNPEYKTFDRLEGLSFISTQMESMLKNSFDLFPLPTLLTTDSEFKRISSVAGAGRTWQYEFNNHRSSEDKLFLFQTAISNIKNSLKEFRTAYDAENFCFCWKIYNHIRAWIYTNQTA